MANLTSSKGNTVFAFDMDGVIVDTVSLFYQAYDDFLKQFGHTSTPEEHLALNGLKIKQIVAYAKKKYALPKNEEELLTLYNQGLSVAYAHPELIPGVKRVINLLKENGFRLVLLSSSAKNNVDMVLNLFQLQKYFDFIMTGDDAIDKSSPHTYTQLKDALNATEMYVIDDSAIALQSAAAAHVQGIFFNPQRQKLTFPVEYDIQTMAEMERIMTEIKANCKTFLIHNNVIVTLIKNDVSYKEQENKVNQIWDAEKNLKKSLCNGTIVSYHSHALKDGSLVINCFLTEYKYFLAQSKIPSLNLPIFPLAVSGVIIDPENNVLVGQRKDVTEYEQCLELVPSGGISSEHVYNDKVLWEEQIKAEFMEETGMSSGDIKKITPFCLIFDKEHKVYDIGVKIMLATSLHQSFNSLKMDRNKEYKNYQIMGLKQIDALSTEDKVVPTSRVILKMITLG